MALFKPILGELSGKIAGNVFAHNRGGSYVRAWKVPYNPNYPLQQRVRAAMAMLVIYWGESLTIEQRAAWATYAANVEMTNRLGEPIFYTGQNHFIRSNVPRVQSESAIAEDAPEIFNLGSFASFSIEAETPTVVWVTFNDQEDWCFELGSYMLIQEGIQQSPTVNFYKSPFSFLFRIAGHPDFAPTSPHQIATTLEMNAGNRMFIRARVSRADARLSASQIVHDIIEDPAKGQEGIPPSQRTP